MTLERAASAGIWSTVELIARQGISFVAVVFLARLLTPSDFGIFALAILAAAFCSTIINGGFSALIVQRDDLTGQDLDRIFSFAVLTSLVAGGLVSGSGFILARIYGHVVLATLMPVLALQPLLSALILVQTALFHKQLQLAPVAKIAGISSLLAGTTAVFAAYSGWGIWALAIQAMVAAVLNALYIWRISDWRPTFTFDLKPLYPLLRYAGPVSVAQGLHVAYTQGFALIVGKRYSAADVGLFNRGFAISQLPHMLFAGLTGKVALPLFSERAADNAAIVRGMKRGLAGVMLISTPAFVGLAILAEDLVILLYGSQWTEAGPVLTILALAGLLMPIQTANVHLLLAKGMSKTFFRVEIEKKAVGITLVIVASFYGIVAVALAYLAASIFWLFLNTRHTGKMIGFSMLDQLRHVSGIFVVTAIMAAALLAFSTTTDLSNTLTIAASIPIGIIVYFGVGLLARIPAFQLGYQDAKLIIARLR